MKYTNCIKCGARLDIAENQTTSTERANKAFADRYCKRCLTKRPTSEPIIEQTSKQKRANRARQGEDIERDEPKCLAHFSPLPCPICKIENEEDD